MRRSPLALSDQTHVQSQLSVLTSPPSTPTGLWGQPHDGHRSWGRQQPQAPLWRHVQIGVGPSWREHLTLKVLAEQPERGVGVRRNEDGLHAQKSFEGQRLTVK